MIHIRRIATVFVAVALFFSLTAITPSASEIALDSSDITPVSGSTYTISTAEQLINFSNVVNSGKSFSGATVKLLSDITLNAGMTFSANGSTSGTPAAFTPIGTASHPFSGTFDGNGMTVRGVYINDNASIDCAGFFGYVSSATVSDLTLANSYIAGNNTVGGICATAARASKLINCTNSAYIVGSGAYTAGICALLEDTSTITACANTAAIRSSSEKTGADASSGVGGVCGACTVSASNVTISRSYNMGSVTASCGNVGGVVGYTTAAVERCYNAGDITGGNYVGGICGFNEAGNLENCYNLAAISGVQCIGGIVGYAKSDTNYTYSIGEITGDDSFDGIAGSSNGIVNYSYTTAPASNTGTQITFDKLAGKTLPNEFDSRIWTYANTDTTYCYPSLIDVINPDLTADSNGDLINNPMQSAVATLPNDMSTNVSATYATAAAAAIVYNVSVSWGSLDFTYTEGTAGKWDPSTHSYIQSKDGVWSCADNANLITITNHSNAALTASFAYVPSNDYSDISGSFSTPSMPLASAVGIAVSNAPSGSTALTLSGTLPSGSNGTDIGKVIISFTSN